MATERPKVGLALSSGAARGLAHLGVLQVLREEEVPVDVIAGCSAGAIFGGLFAIGADLVWAERLVTSLMWEHLLDVGIPRMGFSRGDRFLQILKLLTKDKTFADLETKFGAVAVDLERAEAVLITEGPLAEAILASASIPGVFAPRRVKGRMLVDGSLISRIPVDEARRLGAETVIAVDVSMDPPYGEVKNVMSVILRSIDIMMGQLARYKSQGQADLVIKPDLSGIEAYDLGAGSRAVEAGRAAARAALPAIRQLLAGAPGVGRGAAGEAEA